MNKRSIPFILYFLMTLLCIVLWIPFPDCYHFAGASSLFYALIFAIGSENSAIIWTVICCLPLAFFLLGFSVSSVIKEKSIFPCLLIMVSDLLASLAFLAVKIFTHNYIGLQLMLIGIISRLLYLLWAICFSYKNK